MKSVAVRLVVSLAVFSAVLFLVMQHQSEKFIHKESMADLRRGNDPEATAAMEALRWYNNQRAYPAERIPDNWREKAVRHTELYNMQKSSVVTSLSWSSVGPDNIGGRVRSIAVDPTNANIVYCGSVSGGLWKSTTGGGNWMPLTDFAPNLCIGCIAIDPINTQIIYAGTGEGYFNIDALRGVGVLKSTDGGATWSVLNGFTGASSPYYYYFINKIVINPTNSSILYAALSSSDVGIWKSTNAGANWAKITTIGATSRFCADLVMDPTNPNVLYGAFGVFSTDGIYKTTNGGTNWTKLNTGGFPAATTKYQRISLAIAPSNTYIIYACLADSNYYTHSIQKSIDGGATWTAVTTPYDGSPQVSGTHLGGQGWYNNGIVVHPTNPNIVYTGGINLFKTTDGGTSWAKISDGYGTPYVHVDQHAITFDPTNSSIMYFGCDGGIFKSTNGGSSFVDMNTGFRTVQFYSGAVHPTVAIYYGGTQDNGTLKSGVVPTWSVSLGGDGGAVWVDYSTPTTVYTEYVNLCLQKSLNSGASWFKNMGTAPNNIPNGPNQYDGTTDRSEFIAPYAMDPTNPLILVAGTYKIYRTANGGSSWSSISGDLTGDGTGSTGATISAIGLAKSSSITVYVGTSGSSTIASKIQVTINASSVPPTWTDVTKSPLPNRYVRAFAVNPSNRDSSYVVYSGYNTSTPTTPGHVFFTPNRGTSWTNVSGDLPDIPVNAIVIDPVNVNHLIVGTDLGVYESGNGGVNWTQQNTGMANVSVTDLDRNDAGYLFAATHGRGMFKSDLPAGVLERSPIMPKEFVLQQNYPNPFNPSTTIKFELAHPALVTIKIYNPLGQTVALLAHKKYYDEGITDLHFDGSALPSGVYYCQMVIESVNGKGILYTDVKKMLLVK